MKYFIFSFILINSILFISCQNESSTIVPTFNRDLISKAHKAIEVYNSGKVPVNNVVKVVYFHGSDKAPLDNWRERLTRTLDDVSNFYKEEFYKYGIETDGIPFEKNGDDYVFNVITGDSISQNYNIKSGVRIQMEIWKKAKGKIDLSKDHVLVINGLSFKKDDGTYVFHSPYHGTGSLVNGICHVADCEQLDSKLLTDSVKRMVFSEMMIKRKACSVAEFNSWYIGGIAHELGHVFGLPHDYGQPSEFDSKHISLMGQYGSRHFRDYLWHGEVSASFSSASILQLMSHPVFSKSAKTTGFALESLSFDKKDNKVIVNTKIRAKELPYALVALIRPSSKSEYFNMSFSSIVTTDKPTIELDSLQKGDYYLQLQFLFADGTFRRSNRMISVDKYGDAKETNFLQRGKLDIQKLHDKFQKLEKTKEVEITLGILNGILNPPPPIDLKTTHINKLSVSDAKWEKATVGWDKLARNYFSKESEFKLFLKLKGKLYNKGLYAHSPASFVYNLDRKWKTFSATIGIRDYAHTQGSAIFKVLGDGKILYKSSALRVNQKADLKIDVSKIKTLELITAGAEGHNHNSWAIWVDPILER